MDKKNFMAFYGCIDRDAENLSFQNAVGFVGLIGNTFRRTSYRSQNPEGISNQDRNLVKL